MEWRVQSIHQWKIKEESILFIKNMELYTIMKKNILFIVIIFTNILFAETIGRVMKSNGTVYVKVKIDLDI